MSDVRTRNYNELNPVDQFPGVVRRTLVSGDNLTLVEIRIAPGAEVPEHTHPHEQAGHVAAGRVHFRIGDLERELGPGDSYLIPGDVPHFVQALDSVTLIEVFSPVREEFAHD
jgi:quercetin dioxygenase-like cupin family protein